MPLVDIFEKVRCYRDLFTTTKYSEWEKDERNEAAIALDHCAHAFIAQAKAVFATPNYFILDQKQFACILGIFATRPSPNTLSCLKKPHLQAVQNVSHFAITTSFMTELKFAKFEKTEQEGMMNRMIGICEYGWASNLSNTAGLILFWQLQGAAHSRESLFL